MALLKSLNVIFMSLSVVLGITMIYEANRRFPYLMILFPLIFSISLLIYIIYKAAFSSVTLSLLNITKGGLPGILDTLLVYILFSSFNTLSLSTIFTCITTCVAINQPFCINEIIFSLLIAHNSLYISIVLLLYEAVGYHMQASDFPFTNICNKFTPLMLSIFTLFVKNALQKFSARVIDDNFYIYPMVWTSLGSLAFIFYGYDDITELLNYKNVTDKDINVSIILFIAGTILFSIGYCLVKETKHSIYESGTLATIYGIGTFVLFLYIFNFKNVLFYKYPIEEHLEGITIYSLMLNVLFTLFLFLYFLGRYKVKNLFGLRLAVVYL